jgi:signal peptidase
MSVLSGSMEPEYHVGALVLINTNASAENLSVGDVVTYQLNEESVVTHRVVSVNTVAQTFRTKGDANDIEDLSDVSFAQFIGVPAINIPKLGDFIMNMKSRKNIGIALIFLAFMIVLLVLPTLLSPDHPPRSEAKAQEAKRELQNT